MKKNTITLPLQEKIECLLYAISIQSQYALPEITNRTVSSELFWKNLHRLVTGPLLENCSFTSFMQAIKSSRFIEEVKIFKDRILSFSQIPPAWASEKVRKDIDFHKNMRTLLPSVEGLFRGKNPILVLRSDKPAKTAMPPQIG